MNNHITTYNSKTCIYGNRRNLVVNETLKQYYYSSCNAYNLGIVKNDLGIRFVNGMYKEYKNDSDYTEVKHIEVKNNWK